MIDKLKQYGASNFLKRSLIFILRKIGIRYSKWLICRQNINLDALPEVILDKRFIVREMTFNDFLNSSKFSESKLQVIKKRMKSKNYFSYGVFCDNDLAYYNWISLKEFQFSRNDYEMALNDDEGLIFGAYCYPQYRGNNLHKFMNIYRLKMLHMLNKKSVLVILLKENIPARRTQKLSGFICTSTLITLNVFGFNIHKSRKPIDL